MRGLGRQAGAGRRRGPARGLGDTARGMGVGGRPVAESLANGQELVPPAEGSGAGRPPRPLVAGPQGQETRQVAGMGRAGLGHNQLGQRVTQSVALRGA